MTVELSMFAPDDVEEIVVAWLSPLGRTAIERRTNDELPFRLVRHVAGSENVDNSSATLIVSVHTFADRTDHAAAKDAARATHERMLLLADDPSRDITLSDSRVTNVDYVEVTESPRWEYFADNVLRKVARYQIGLSYVMRDDGS